MTDNTDAQDPLSDEWIAEQMGWYPPSSPYADDCMGARVKATIRAALASRDAEIANLRRWRDTVDDMLTVCHAVASDDPRESIDRLINWHVQVALDPDVSSDAALLVERGRHEAKLRQGEPVPAFWRYRWTLNNQPRPDEIRPNTAPPINIIGYSFPPEPLYASPPPAQPTQGEPAVPEGWQLVPKEPTREMLNTWAMKMPDPRYTGPEAGSERVLGWAAVDEIYRAMLAAAPPPAQPPQAECGNTPYDEGPIHSGPAPTRAGAAAER